MLLKTHPVSTQHRTPASAQLGNISKKHSESTTLALNLRQDGVPQSRYLTLTLVQTLMDRVYEFREQSVKAKQELASLQEENKDLKIRIEQVHPIFLLERLLP